MKTNDKQPILTESVFATVATKFFKCMPDEIIIQMINRGKVAMVIHKNIAYNVSTYDAFREEIEFWLSDKEAANHIHFGCWIQTIKNTVEVKKVIDLLIRDIANIEQAHMLSVAIQLGLNTKDSDIGFWQVLSRIDKTGELVGSAIVATAQVYNGQGLIDDLTQLHIDNGISVYNQHIDGIFEAFQFHDDQYDYPEFYIYSVDAILDR